MSARFLENCLWWPFCNNAALLAWFIHHRMCWKGKHPALALWPQQDVTEVMVQRNFCGPFIALELCVFENSQHGLHLLCSLSQSHRAPRHPGALHSQRTPGTLQHLLTHPHFSQSKAGQRLPKKVCRIGPPGVFKTPSPAFIRTHTKRGVSSSFKLCLFILQEQSPDI